LQGKEGRGWKSATFCLREKGNEVPFPSPDIPFFLKPTTFRNKKEVVKVFTYC